MAKGIENSLIDDRLIDLTAEIMKGQESARKEQQEGRWPERNLKKVKSRSERSALCTLGKCLDLML